MKLTNQHLNALKSAERKIQLKDIEPYLILRQLISQPSPESRIQFQKLFRRYYGLNVAHLGDKFLKTFFEALFQWNKNSDVSTLLTELYAIRTLRGTQILALSFVSKLISIHDEARPIYDRHVRHFFGVKEPLAGTQIADRISWWTVFLTDVRDHYVQWAQDERMSQVLSELRKRFPELARCHDVRLLDFLIWKVGNLKLLS